MFLGRLSRTFLSQTCEGQENNNRGLRQTVVNYKKKIKRKGNIEVILKVLYVWEYITVTTVDWCNIILSKRHSPPAYLSLESARSDHLCSVPFVSCSLFVYFVQFASSPQRVHPVLQGSVRVFKWDAGTSLLCLHEKTIFKWEILIWNY